ncbi:MAG: hypothetical protein ISS47_08805 [Candidatus Omnitrophica bacterium]|nr:hypothetical protein [Candidatus Omnitrophota bacterium]
MILYLIIRCYRRFFYFGFSVGELSCPTLYNEDSSSINFTKSLKYGIGVLLTGLKYIIAKLGLAKITIFDKNGKRYISKLKHK